MTVNGVSTSYTILPKSINSLVATLYDFVVLGLFIYAIVKYFQIKNNKSVNVQNSGIQQQNNGVVQQSVGQQSVLQQDNQNNNN